MFAEQTKCSLKLIIKWAFCHLRSFSLNRRNIGEESQPKQQRRRKCGTISDDIRHTYTFHRDIARIGSLAKISNLGYKSFKTKPIWYINFTYRQYRDHRWSPKLFHRSIYIEEINVWPVGVPEKMSFNLSTILKATNRKES